MSRERDTGHRPGQESATLLVTFSGESGAHLDNIAVITPDGGLTTDLLQPDPALELRELRGMAWSADGALLVADAHRRQSQVLRFERGPDAPGGVPAFQHGRVFAGPGSTPGLMHPYGIAVATDGDVLVSSQDTYIVARFDADGSPASMAHAWRQQYPEVSFYPGTWVPGHGRARRPKHPHPIPSHRGGLVAPRDVVVTGDRLYVADVADTCVKCYDLSSGDYLGKIVSFRYGRPTGLAVDAGAKLLYVSAQESNSIHVVDISRGDGRCPHRKIVEQEMDGVALHHPAGLCLLPAGGEARQLIVASRKGRQLNRYHLDRRGAVMGAEVLVVDLPDQPEQLLAVPGAR